MRISYAIHLPTTQYVLSNGFNSESAVKAWIAEQPTPTEYIVGSIDLPNQQWITVKAKLDHVTHNAVLASNLASVKVSSFGEVQAPPKSAAPAPVTRTALTAEEVASIMQECDGLAQLLVGLHKNLDDWNKAAPSSQQESTLRTITQEIASAEVRMAYLQAQVAGLQAKDVEGAAETTQVQSPMNPPLNPPMTGTVVGSAGSAVDALKAKLTQQPTK